MVFMDCPQSLCHLRRCSRRLDDETRKAFCRQFGVAKRNMNISDLTSDFEGSVSYHLYMLGPLMLGEKSSRVLRNLIRFIFNIQQHLLYISLKQVFLRLEVYTK